MLPKSLSYWIRACLFIGVWSASALVARSGLGSVDEGFVHRTTVSLAERGSWSIEPLSGRTTSRYSLLPSVLAVPFHWLAHLAVGDAPRHDEWESYAVKWSSCALVATTALLLAIWIVELGYGETSAIGCSLLFAFGTMALPYSSTLYVQVATTPAALGLLRSIYHRQGARSAVWGALLLGCRLDLAILFPGLALAILQDRGDGRLRRIAWLVAGAAMGSAAVVAVAHLRGDPWIQGAYVGEDFATPLLVGLGGLLVSFGKGLAWYSPLSFFGLCGLLGWAMRCPWPGRTVVYFAVVFLAATSQWWTWHGGLTWGPRLLLPLLPLCMLPIADWWSQWSVRPVWQRRLFLLAAAVSLCVNLRAAVQPPLPSDGFSEIESIYLPSASPLAAAWEPATPWLWQAPASAEKIWLATGLAMVSAASLLALAAHFRAWKQVSQLAGLVVVIALVLYSRDSLQGGANEQYRRLTPIGDGAGFRGLLSAPLRGVYQFFVDPRSATSIRLDGHELFSRSPVAQVELDAGEHSIEIVGKGVQPGTLRWTTPGLGEYRSSIDAWNFLPLRPTAGQRGMTSAIRMLWIVKTAACLGMVLWLFGAGMQESKKESAHSDDSSSAEGDFDP